MVVHPAPGNWNGTLVNALAHRIEQGAGWKDDAAQRPGIVHRLDKGTSGVRQSAHSARL
jgi:23S rRNA pseudouridine1911/1915/1917 synthase